MRQRYVREIERIFNDRLADVVQKIRAAVGTPATPTGASAGSSIGGATCAAGDATTTPSASPTRGPSITAPEASRTSAPRASARRPATIGLGLTTDASVPGWVTRLAAGRSETPEQTLAWIHQFVEESYGPMDNWLKFFEVQFVGEELKRGG